MRFLRASCRAGSLIVCLLLVATGTALAVRVPSTPLGTSFQTTLSGKSALLNGTWTLSFSPTGAYTVAKQPSTRILIGGTATVAGHTIVFVDSNGPNACTGSQVRGAYSWTMTAGKLRLKVTSDACSGRATVLGSGTFVKTG